MANQTHPKSVSKEDFDALIQAVMLIDSKLDALSKQVLENVRTRAGQTAEREMTDDDARNIMTGELKDAKHNDAAAKLGLSYGQVYSARLGYTFKHIHKEMKDAGIRNSWAKETA